MSWRGSELKRINAKTMVSLIVNVNLESMQDHFKSKALNSHTTGFSPEKANGLQGNLKTCTFNPRRICLYIYESRLLASRCNEDARHAQHSTAKPSLAPHRVLNRSWGWSATHT